MFRMLKGITKVALGVVVAPVAVVADVVTLPGSAYNGGSPFERTEKVLRAVERNVCEVVG